MILYHFTARWARDSILRDGLQPGRRSDLDHALLSPLQPCVWLTTDPKMPDGHSSYNDLRITVDIPSDDHQLQLWPTYWREQAKDERKDTIDNLIASDHSFEPTRFFYCYFGTIKPQRFEADDEV
jgi:hypothetical protein